jgi:uncharacterized paraquat-inducible protein A
MRKTTLQNDEKAHCPRCGYELYAHRHNVVARSLALVLTALLLYVPANFLPIMQLHLLGQTSDDTVWSGVLGLYNSGNARRRRGGVPVQHGHPAAQAAVPVAGTAEHPF